MSFIADIIAFVSGTSTDVLLAAIAFAICIGATLYFGSSLAVNVILSWYIALTIFRNISLENFTALPSLLIFLAIVLGVYFIIKKMISAHETYSTGRRAMRAAVLSVSVVVLVFVTLIYVVPIREMYVFSPAVFKIFASSYLVWWLVIPVIALFLARRI